MEYTQHYNLKKPGPDDFYDVNDCNTNFETVDAALRAIETRKVNNKALTTDITLTAADVGARPGGWNPSLADCGGTLAIGKGGTGATTAALARNALGLGNTAGALPVANGGTGATTAALARNALGITPANIGAAASSHGTHVSYSGSAPLMDGTAAAGAAATVARSDHRHPTDTGRAAASHSHPISQVTNLNAQLANKVEKDTKITWTALPMLSNFAAGEIPSMVYSKDSAGWVQVMGVFIRSAAPAAGEPIALLPVGFRPSRLIPVVFMQPIGTGGTPWCANGWIRPDGYMNLTSIAPPGNYNPAYETSVSATYKAI